MELTFNKTGDYYTAAYLYAGDTIVQVERKDKGNLIINAYLDGMAPARVKAWTADEIDANVILDVNIPAGVNVEIASQSEVSTGKTLER